MQISFDEFEQVHKYLIGEMTSEQKDAFLLAVRKNIELAEYLKFEQELHVHLLLKEADKNFEGFGMTQADFDIIPSAEDEKIFNMFKAGRTEDEAFITPAHSTAAAQIQNAREDINQEIPHKSAPQENNIVPMGRSKQFYRLIAAAAILLAAGTGVSIYLINQSPNNENIANVQSQASGGENSVRTAGGTHNQLSDSVGMLASRFYTKDTSGISNHSIEGLDDYRNNNYKTIQKLDPNKLANGHNGPANELKDTAYYYKGLSYMETNDTEKAITNFNWVITHTDNEALHVKAQWYLALVYLKKKDVQTAMPLLRIVSNNKIEPDLKEKAISLIAQLPK